LRALEPRRLGARPERPEAGVREAVDEPERERQLGTDDGQVDAMLAREGEEPGQVVRRDRHALRLYRDPGVPGRAPERVDARTLAELPDEGVLASAAADDQEPHVSAGNAARR